MLRIMSSDEKTYQQRRDEWTVRRSSPLIWSSTRSADKLDELLDSDQFSAVRLALTRLKQTVGPAIR